MKSTLALGAGLITVALWSVPPTVAPRAAAMSTTVGFISTDVSTEGLGSYEGTILYDYNSSQSEGQLVIDISNTTSVDSSLTSFGFNIAGDNDETLDLTDAPVDGSGPTPWELLSSGDKKKTTNGSPYGTFEWGTTVGNKLLAGKTDEGLASGESGEFTFSVLDGEVSSLTAIDFITETADSGAGEIPFFARFQGVGADGEASDKVGAALIPAPATALAGLVMFGYLGLSRGGRWRGGDRR